MRTSVACGALAGVVIMLTPPPAQSQVLPSWNDGPAKQAIMEFVRQTTSSGGPGYVPPDERIVVFDNDGTLWPENPLPFEIAFVIDQIRKDAYIHPEWTQKQPYKAALESDIPGIIAQGRDGLAQLLMETHAGMSADVFAENVRSWITSAKHPRYNRLYGELAYQPMLELLQYLRMNEFKTYIVSGGGAEFMRVFAQHLYGIPPEQIIGTLFKTKYEIRNGQPMLSILPELIHFDDKEGKPRAIHQIIGRKPIAAIGNSDGDQQMLQLTTIGRPNTLGVIVHHTDAEREYAYDSHPKSSGKLVDALVEGRSRGWAIVDMKRDWKRIFSFDKQ